MRELKIGDKVKITKEGYYNGRFDVGDILYVVGTVAGGSDTCPYYLSKDKKKETRRGNVNYFGPYRTSYEYIPINNIIGGEIL